MQQDTQSRALQCRLKVRRAARSWQSCAHMSACSSCALCFSRDYVMSHSSSACIRTLRQSTAVHNKYGFSATVCWVNEDPAHVCAFFWAPQAPGVHPRHAVTPLSRPSSCSKRRSQDQPCPAQVCVAQQGVGLSKHVSHQGLLSRRACNSGVLCSSMDCAMHLAASACTRTLRHSS